MKIAYFQPFSGASGDMALGALVDAGLPLAELEAGLGALQLPGWRLERSRVMRGAFAATRLRVITDDAPPPKRTPTDDSSNEADENADDSGHSHHHDHGHDHHDHHHRNDHRHGEAEGPNPGAEASRLSGDTPARSLSTILAMIGDASLPTAVQENATAVFRRLGEVEARAHDQPLESVHFHEVGAVDSIVDIVGTCLALHLLGVDEVRSAPVTVGTGFVRGAHGRIPLPSPATIALLRGFPVEQRDSRAELTTPTGAALLTTLASEFGTMPPLVVNAVGYGAGGDRPGPVPNLLRVIVGERPSPPPGGDRILVLETNIDDMSPEWTAHLAERLLAGGALDVWLTPILMKKGRPGQELRVLAPLDKELEVARVLFAESTTFGLRRRECDRLTLEREFHSVDTPWGPVRVKVGTLDGEVLSVSPEYEDLRLAAERSGRPLKELHRIVMERHRGECD